MMEPSQIFRMKRATLTKFMWVLVALLSCLIAVPGEAAIAVRGTSTAYYRSTSQHTTGTTAPSVVGVGAPASAASGSVTPTLPAAFAAGDLLLCMVESHDQVTPTLPSGWTRIYRSQSETHYSAAWYKAANATEANPTVTHSNGGSIIAQCSAYRNVLLATPTYSAASGTGAFVRSGSVTTTLANELLLMAAHLNQGATTTSGWTMSVAGGLTWTPQFASTTTLGSGTPVAGSSIGLFSATKTTTGSQTAVTATIAGTVNSSSNNYGVLLDLKFGLAINKPVGTVEGDLMVLSIAARSSAATITPPAGWTLLLSNTQTNQTNYQNSTSSKLSTYYKVAGASEPASYTWSSGTTESVASLVSFSGVDTTTPFDNVTPLGTANTSATTTQIAPSISPKSTNDWLLTVHELTSTPCSGSFTNGWSPPTGMTERTDTCSRSSSGVGMEVATLALTTAGVSTGTKTATAASRAARGISQSMVLKPLVAATLDHLEIDYPAPPFSTCSATPVTVYACADSSCSSYFTGGVGVTLSPGGNVLAIPAGSGSGVSTVFQTSAGAATLGAVFVPASGTTTCKNSSTGGFGCGVTFSSAALTLSVPNLAAGNSATGTLSGCTAQLPLGANSINFYTTYQDPASGTKQASINGTSLSTSSPGTAVSLNFDGASPASSATFSLSYPDVGKLGLTAVKASGATGSASLIVVPHHFALSSVTCGDGATYVGCSVTSPYANPAAGDATGAAFMKAGYPFSIVVGAYNSANAVTPNFGRESSPESVSLAPSVNMPDLAGAVAGNFAGALGAFSNGLARGNTFTYDEVGIITLSLSLNDPQTKGYLSIGNQSLNPVSTTSANIGRFIPDHFEVNSDALNPILARTDLSQTAALATGTTAPATVIGVDSTAGFFIGSRVRIPGAAAGGNVFLATVTAVDAVASTLTLDTPIGTTLAGGESVVEEWGSYLGEQMNANFVLTAVDAASNLTTNYQDAYAKLDLTAGSNPLGLGAVDTAGPTYNLALDASAVVSGSFNNGSAAISAPFVVTRGASPTGPFNAVQIGIAPTSAEADGVKMGAYDLSVAGGATDHTSIMDPQVQAVTQLRYGRLKISNAYGSELLALPVRNAAQYYAGTTWVTNVQDNLSTPGGPLMLSAVAGTPFCAGLTFAVAPVTVASGAGTFTLTRPSNGRCSADLTLSAPGYLPSAAGRATFGIYKSPLIYRRENY
jgi:hypothetical protein